MLKRVTEVRFSIHVLDTMKSTDLQIEQAVVHTHCIAFFLEEEILLNSSH
jgi:hypothetical protein